MDRVRAQSTFNHKSMMPNSEPNPGSALLGERLIDAREASYCLNLPLYWLTHPKERNRRCTPHYRVGKLVRFKLSQLENWLRASAGAQAKTAGGTDA